MNLDRFSVAFGSEFSFNVVDESFVEVNEVLTCCGCGEQLYVGEEEVVESELWEDEYLHNDNLCKWIYFKKNKAAVVGGSGLV